MRVPSGVQALEAEEFLVLVFAILVVTDILDLFFIARWGARGELLSVNPGLHGSVNCICFIAHGMFYKVCESFINYKF
jgi:hypothetical protein